MQLLDAEDLSVITTIETSLTTERVGHLFMMCGVLYATKPDLEEEPGVIRYAVDTVTGRTKEVYIQYPNNYKHIVQIQYNMREKTLFVWDNGRQIIFALDFVY